MAAFNNPNFLQSLQQFGVPQGGQAGPGGVFSGGSNSVVPNSPAFEVPGLNNPVGSSGGGGGDTGFGFFNEFDADKNLTQRGLFAPALQGIGGAFNIYSGLKQLGQQEDALDFQKDSFNRNFAANKAAFQERLRADFSRKKTLGGNKGLNEEAEVARRSNF